MADAFEYIDIHVHILPEERSLNLMRWTRRFMPDHPVPVEITPDGIVDDLHAAGARVFWNHVFALHAGESRSLNRFNAELAERYRGLLPFATVHPEEEDRLAILEEALDELRLVGLKLHPMVTRFQPWQDAMLPVYAALNERGRPLLIHSGYDEFYRYGYGVDQLERIAAAYPDLTLILAHMIFPQIPEAFDLVDRFPNVYLDATNVCGSLTRFLEMFGPGDMETHPLATALREGIARHPDRVVFGSDHPAGLGDLRMVLEDMAAIPFSPTQRAAMLRETPLRLTRQFDTGWLGETELATG